MQDYTINLRIFFNKSNFICQKPGMIEIKCEIDYLKAAFEKLDPNEEQLLQLNHLKRLHGQFKFKLNSFFSCLTEKSNLTHDLHVETKTNQQLKYQGNLSCMDLYLIKNPHEIEKVN